MVWLDWSVDDEESSPTGTESMRPRLVEETGVADSFWLLPLGATASSVRAEVLIGEEPW